VSIFRAGKDLPHPFEQRVEIWIRQSLAVAHEEKAARQRQRLLHRLRVIVANDLVIGSVSEHDGVRRLPMSMQVQDARLISTHNALHLGTLTPSHRRKFRDVFQQAVVIRRRKLNAQILQRGQNLRVVHTQCADGITQPLAVLAALGPAQAPLDLRSDADELDGITGAQLLTLLPAPVFPGPRIPHAFAARNAVLEQANPRGGRRPLGRTDGDPGADDGDDLAVGDLLSELRERKCHAWSPCSAIIPPQDQGAAPRVT
jgi:hypothetical protein